jgi:hypothetical protein
MALQSLFRLSRTRFADIIWKDFEGGKQMGGYLACADGVSPISCDNVRPPKIFIFYRHNVEDPLVDVDVFSYPMFV